MLSHARTFKSSDIFLYGIADSEAMLYQVFQIWAEHIQLKQKRQGQSTYLPTFQQLTAVCHLLCTRWQYAQALGLAKLAPNMSAQHAAEHASTVFEAARAAQRQLGSAALRIIMAQCVLGGTSASLRCCSQVCVDSLAAVCIIHLHSSCSSYVA